MSLPKGWIKVKVSDVSEFIRGVTYKKTETSEFSIEGFTPILRANNIQNGKIVFDDLVFVKSEKVKQKQHIRKGDIVIAMSSGSKNLVGKTAKSDEDYNIGFGAFCGLLRPSLFIDKSFFGWFFQSREYKDTIKELSAGMNINNLKGSHFEEVYLALPPFNEQKCIAKKLDELLSTVERIKTRLDNAPILIKRFRQSVLAAATSGRLTEEWRRENGVSDEWENLAMADVLEDIRYGTSKKCTYEQAIPVLRIPNIGDKGIITEDLKYAQFNEKELGDLSLKEGDILVIRSNGSIDLVGKNIVVEKKHEGYLYAGYLIRMRFNQMKVLPKYAHYVLSSPKIRETISLTSKSTSGVNNVNSKELSSFPIDLPSLEEQKEIVSQVESLFAVADALEEKIEAAKKRIDKLTQSILAKAFRGELVPQDPNDEPAEKLLERIRAEQEALKPKKRSRKKKSKV